MTSGSDIAPTPEWMTRTRTSSFESFSSEVFTASALPCTSAFTMMLKSFISPCCILANRSSSVTFFATPRVLSFSCCLRSSTSSLAMRSSATALKVSPAPGTSLMPAISTGMDGPASVTRWPLSFIIVLTLPTAVPAMIISP